MPKALIAPAIQESIAAKSSAALDALSELAGLCQTNAVQTPFYGDALDVVIGKLSTLERSAKAKRLVTWKD